MLTLLGSDHRELVSKTWEGNFDDLEVDQAERAQSLFEYGNHLSPKVFVNLESRRIVVQQEWIDGITPINSERPYVTIHALADSIDQFHALGLVHGDLCFSNVGLKDGKVFIFDWEPVLVIRHADRKIEYRTTRFAFHPTDLKRQKISFLSDRLAFICLFLQIVNARYRGLDIAEKYFQEIQHLSEIHRDCATLANVLPKLDFLSENLPPLVATTFGSSL